MELYFIGKDDYLNAVAIAQVEEFSLLKTLFKNYTSTPPRLWDKSKRNFIPVNVVLKPFLYELIEVVCAGHYFLIFSSRVSLRPISEELL